MTDTDRTAVPRMDMTRVASGFSQPHPALSAGEHSPAVTAMNAALWDLVEVTLFRAKAALQHHGYDEVISEINSAISDVASAWAEVIDPGSMVEPAHVLSEPHHPSNPDGRDFWVVDCSCGYSTAPTAQPQHALVRADNHVAAKAAQR